jgi:hypothetical protein
MRYCKSRSHPDMYFERAAECVVEYVSSLHLERKHDSHTNATRFATVNQNCAKHGIDTETGVQYADAR